MILPKPKQMEYFDRKLYLQSKMDVLVKDDYGIKALKILNAIVSEINVVFLEGENCNIELILSATDFSHKEEYRIELNNGKLVLTYGDRLGARNAIISLYHLIERDTMGYFIRVCKITDYPDSTYRGIMLDLGRKYIPVEEIKTTIMRMAKAKYNVLRLHLLESEHNPLESDIYPQLNKTSRRQYTKDEMKEIVAFATSFELEVIPEIEMPGHGFFIIDRLEELKCKTKSAEPSRWTMCIGSERTYEILGNLIREITEIFPGEYIHIGTDEIEFYDIFKIFKMWPTWDDCEVCTDLSQREKIEGKRELFYYFVKRIHKIITGLGKKMMMWNDQIDISVSPDLPRDIRIQFWNVANDRNEGRGPYKGCSMQRFLEEGFEVVNSYFRETYLDANIEEEKLLKWNPKARPECTDDVKHLIIGGEMCTWGPDLHYGRTLPSAAFIFGDKLWDDSDREITCEYRQTLTKAVLGLQTPTFFDVFEAFGCSLLPLLENRMGMPEKVNLSKAKLEEKINVLQTMIAMRTSGDTAARAYAKSVQWVLDELLIMNNGRDF